MSTLSQEKIKEIVTREIFKAGDSLGPMLLALGPMQVEYVARAVAAQIAHEEAEK